MWALGMHTHTQSSQSLQAASPPLADTSPLLTQNTLWITVTTCSTLRQEGENEASSLKGAKHQQTLQRLLLQARETLGQR